MKYEVNVAILLLLWSGTSFAHTCWNIFNYNFYKLTVTFVTFDVIFILVNFSGKVTTQLRSGGKFLTGLCAKSYLTTPVKEW